MLCRLKKDTKMSQFGVILQPIFSFLKTQQKKTIDVFILKLLKNGTYIYWVFKDELVLRQCSGEKSIFFNNATNELLFGRKHCFYDLNIKMVHFCTFIMRLLWKLGKIAAILDSRRRKKRSQFWIFCYQIFNISKKLQYLQTYQRDFWNFEKKSIF